MKYTKIPVLFLSVLLLVFSTPAFSKSSSKGKTRWKPTTRKVVLAKMNSDAELPVPDPQKAVKPSRKLKKGTHRKYVITSNKKRGIVPVSVSETAPVQEVQMTEAPPIIPEKQLGNPNSGVKPINFISSVEVVRAPPLIAKQRKLAKKGSPKKGKPKTAGKNQKADQAASPDPENLPNVSSPDLKTPPIENAPVSPPKSQEPAHPAILEPDERMEIGSPDSSWDKTRDIFAPGGKFAPVTIAKEAEKKAAKGLLTKRIPELQGILKCSDKDEMAILNDQMVRKGSEVDGFRVMKINKNSVVLNRDGEEIVLNVKQ